MTSDIDYKKLLLCLGIGMCLWYVPHPSGITTTGWHVLSIFITTIIALIIKPVPMGLAALASMTILIVTHAATPKQALIGFSNPSIWLMLIALFIARGFVNTGLGRRLALIFTKYFGKKTVTLSYGLALTDLILSPAIPSVTARSAGIVFPILQGISQTYHSYPNDPSSRRIGAYLIVTAFQITVITSAMFMTAMAANPLIASLVHQQSLELSWGTWAMASIVPGLCSLLFVPYFISLIYPPEIKHTPQATEQATKELTALGPMSLHEKIMSITAVCLVSLWIIGDHIGVSAVTTAMIGLSILLFTQVLRWQDLMEHHSAWDTYFWFSVLLMLASTLNDTGVVSWFSESLVNQLHGFAWVVALPLIVLIYFYSHYFFASATAHVTSMFVPMLVVALAIGAPPMLAVITLIFTSNLFGGLTHYSLAPAPIFFGAGYVPLTVWWKIGFLVSLVNLTIWGTIGLGWWHLIGLW